MIGLCGDTLQLDTAEYLGGWALQGYSEALRLVTAGMLGGRALQGCCALGPAVWFWAEGKDNIDFKISQLHCEGGEKGILFT